MNLWFYRGVYGSVKHFATVWEAVRRQADGTGWARFDGARINQSQRSVFRLFVPDSGSAAVIAAERPAQVTGKIQQQREPGLL